MKVLKFGGTSVGKPERMEMVKELITRDQDSKVVVLSAVSGTTNSLVEIGQALYAKDKAKGKQLIDALYEHYQPFVKSLYKTEEGYSKGKSVVDTRFGVIRGLLEFDFTDREERLLLAQGELISTKLFHHYLEEIGITSRWLPALDFMSVDEDHEPELEKISERLKSIIDAGEQVGIYVTQGYICRNAKGEVDNLKRGGSDYTASLVGAALDAQEVQIWTDIDGMHNNDPRVVDQTRPIAQLNFDEAAELAYFGAKILHPATIRPAQQVGTPVKLLNTMDPDAKGTTISGEAAGSGVKAIAAKDDIIAIKVKSSRMLLAYGFMRKIFEVFEKYRTPIDMITTSEVAVSLTIDDATHLDEIIKELDAFGKVEVDKGQTIVSCVGANIVDEKGLAMKVFDALEEIPVRMISFGGSRNNISILIKMENKVQALQALNKGLFNL